MEILESKNMKASGRYRKFLLTLNEDDLFIPDHDSIKSILSGINNIRYWCMCDEFDKTYEVRHTHVFILFDIPVSVAFMSEKFPDVNIQYFLPPLNECMDYMRKQGQYCSLNKFEENFPDTFEDSFSCSEDGIPVVERKFVLCIFEVLYRKVNKLWKIWKQHISEKKKK